MQRHWPAGASAPFSEKVTGLYAARGYSFRVCGKGDSATGSMCAQTRTFTTTAPVQDSVVGSWVPSPHFTGSVDAHSPRPDPLGTISARDSFDELGEQRSLRRRIALHVPDRRHGGLVAVDEQADHAPGEGVDGGPSGTDLVGVTIDLGTFPRVCSEATFQNLRSIDGGGDLVVNNAP